MFHILAIGTGKSTIATYIILYMIYMVLCIKGDPHKFFGISASRAKIVFAFFNTTKTKAQKTCYGAAHSYMLGSPWFRKHGYEVGDRYKEFQAYKPISLDIGSEEYHITSLDVYGFLFDEVNDVLHSEADFNASLAMTILNAANQRIRSRFKSSDRKTFFGKSIIISSKQSEVAFLEQYINDRKRKNVEGIYIVDEPQWEILPLELSGKVFSVAYGNKNAKSRILSTNEDKNEVLSQGYKILDVPEEYRQDFEDNLNRALTEVGGVSVSYIDKFFSREYISKATDFNRSNPFSTDIIISGLRDKDEYSNYFDDKKIPYDCTQESVYMHIDTSKSKDKTGISAVSQSLTNPEEIHHLFTVYIQAPKNDQICFAKHENFIYYLYDKLNWNIQDVSSDGYNSDQLKQNMILHGINASYVSADVDITAYTALQRSLYDGNMKILHIPLLQKELLELDLIRGTREKLDHPPATQGGSKDGSDSLACAVKNLKQHQVDDSKNKSIIEPEIVEKDLLRSFSETTQQNNSQQSNDLFSSTSVLMYQQETQTSDSMYQQTTKTNDDSDVDMEYFRF